MPPMGRHGKICYPGYIHCEFDSLKDAVLYFNETGSSLEYRIPKIIMYNICYRDYLREHGLEILLKRIVRDIPELMKDEKTIQSIREWYDEEGKELAY